MKHQHVHKDSITCSPQTTFDSSQSSSSESSKSTIFSPPSPPTLQANEASCTAKGHVSVSQVTIQNVTVLQVNLLLHSGAVPAAVPASLAHHQQAAAHACQLQTPLSRNKKAPSEPEANSACKQQAFRQFTASTTPEDATQALLKVIQHGGLGGGLWPPGAEPTALAECESVQTPIAALQDMQPYALTSTARGIVSNPGLAAPEPPDSYRPSDHCMLDISNAAGGNGHIKLQCGDIHVQQLALSNQPEATHQQYVASRECNTTAGTLSFPPYQSPITGGQAAQVSDSGLAGIAGSVVSLPVGNQTSQATDSPVAEVADCSSGRLNCHQTAQTEVPWSFPNLYVYQVWRSVLCNVIYIAYRVLVA